MAINKNRRYALKVVKPISLSSSVLATFCFMFQLENFLYIYGFSFIDVLLRPLEKSYTLNLRAFIDILFIKSC